NVPLYRALLRDSDVRAGRLDIAMLDRKLQSGELAPSGDAPPDLALVAAALAHFERARKGAAAAPGAHGSGAAPPAVARHRARWGLVARREALRGGGWS